jgi:hypothetical protein
MQIRPYLESTTTIASLTSGSGISFVAAAGQIDITIPAATTALMDFVTAVYDFELVTPAGKVIRLVEGTVKLSREVTR